MSYIVVSRLGKGVRVSGGGSGVVVVVVGGGKRASERAHTHVRWRSGTGGAHGVVGAI